MKKQKNIIIISLLIILFYSTYCLSYDTSCSYIWSGDADTITANYSDGK